MKMEYKYFTYRCWWDYNAKKLVDNTEDLNKLVAEGWEPVRETAPSNPEAGNSANYCMVRTALVVLQKRKRRPQPEKKV